MMRRTIISAVVMFLTMTAVAETHSRPNTTFAFVGDIMMGTSYPETPKGAFLPADDGKHLFKDCKEILSAVDVACGNQEGTLIDKGGKAKLCGNPATCFTFRTPTRYVANLVDAGFDFMNIANNHINDFGPMGKASTQLTLKNAGIAYAGLQECPTAVIVRNGRKIGFAAFGFSRGTCNLNDLALVRRTVSELKKECDLVVVTFHGGAEGPKYTHVPFATESAFGENRGDEAAFAHTAVDAGADVVYGHGPHVNRAMELYKDRLIMYSLGNFCTPYKMNVSGISGYAPIVTVELDSEGRFAGGKIHPFIQQKGCGPRPDTSGAVIRNLRTLSKADFPGSPLQIADDGTLK